MTGKKAHVDYLKLSFGHKVGTEQGAGQQARADDQVLRLVEEGQRCLGLPLRHLCAGGGRGGKRRVEMWFYADMKAHVQSPTVLQQEAVNGGLV